MSHDDEDIDIDSWREGVRLLLGISADDAYLMTVDELMAALQRERDENTAEVELRKAVLRVEYEDRLEERLREIDIRRDEIAIRLAEIDDDEGEGTGGDRAGAWAAVVTGLTGVVFGLVRKKRGMEEGDANE